MLETRVSEAREVDETAGPTVATVTDPVAPDSLGTTLMHEHLIVDLRCNFIEPDEASLRLLSQSPVDLSTLSDVRRRPFTCLDNLLVADEELVIDELRYFAREGGRTVVDVTSIGLGRDPRAVQRIARATGLNIILGTGCYVERAHPDWVARASVTELSSLFVSEVQRGIDGTSVRAGIIGEIGTSGITKGCLAPRGTITQEETKVLRAAGRAAIATGVAVSLHLDPRVRGAFDVLRILDDEGVPRDRIILGHLDFIEDYAYHLAIARQGVTLEFDSLGKDFYIEELGLAAGHDTWRVRFLAQLVADGYEDQIVLGQDCCMKIDLRRFGGQGYGHILRNLVAMLEDAGVARQQIVKFLVDNPRRLLTPARSE